MPLEEAGNAGAEDKSLEAFDDYWQNYWQMFHEPLAFDIGDHSISWLTVRELLEYDWPQPYRGEESLAPTVAAAAGTS